MSRNIWDRLSATDSHRVAKILCAEAGLELDCYLLAVPAAQDDYGKIDRERLMRWLSLNNKRMSI